jgi:hypothetical protein
MSGGNEVWQRVRAYAGLYICVSSFTLPPMYATEGAESVCYLSGEAASVNESKGDGGTNLGWGDDRTDEQVRTEEVLGKCTWEYSGSTVGVQREYWGNAPGSTVGVQCMSRVGVEWEYSMSTVYEYSV